MIRFFFGDDLVEWQLDQDRPGRIETTTQNDFGDAGCKFLNGNIHATTFSSGHPMPAELS